MTIPVLNIYHMLLYAWDVLEEAEAVAIRADDHTSLVDLFARVLHSGMERAIRRGLDRSYCPIREEIPGIRGRLDFTASIKRGSLRRNHAVCEFDDFTHNVLHNRIIKSTIRRLLLVSDLNAEIRDGLSETRRRLQQIEDVPLSERAFRSVQLHRNNRHYRLLLDVCRLIHQAGLTSEEAGENEFRSFVRDERRMRRLFERFVRNFYRRRAGRAGFRVRGNRLNWAGMDADPSTAALIPGMRTDTRLESARRCIVIETKYVAQMMQEYRGRPTLRSSHLYQLLAYVNTVAQHMPYKVVTGVLLYPAVDQVRDLRFDLSGHALRVLTIDLATPWQEVEASLLQILADQAAGCC